MTNSKTVFNLIKAQLLLDEAEEIMAVSLAIMEKYYRLKLTDILAEKKIEEQNLSAVIARINRHEPLHYIFGEADFYGRKFNVNSSVLIPRPETELLINEVLKTNPISPRILDIGTGSGCIAITLNLEIKNSKVFAVDVSQRSIDTASTNAKTLGADVYFILTDFLKNEISLKPVDLMVSNPPYVKEIEKDTMKPNVLNYEPHQALFVPTDNPLIFYKAIAQKSKTLLKPNGKIVVEINEQFGREVKNLFEAIGFQQTQIIKDLDGKDRIVTAYQ